MNLLSRFKSSGPARRFVLYAKASLRVSAPFLLFGVVDVVVVMAVSERKWKTGVTRIIDQPNWSGYTREQIDEIIKGREQIVESLKDLCEMKPGVAKNDKVAQLFDENCVYEDPMIRLLGREEILSIFNHLPNHLVKSEFKEYTPLHYKDKIIIRALRHSSLLQYGDELKLDPLHSNIVVRVTQEDNKDQQKISSITDEWNYVALMQPETHNAYLFAGSIARGMRRVSYFYVKPDKSLFNFFIIFDWKGKLSTFLNQKLKYLTNKELTETEKPKKIINESGNPIFNAGVSREPK